MMNQLLYYKQSDIFYIYSDEVEKYRYPEGCPFKVERADLTRKLILNSGLLSFSNTKIIEPRYASREEVEKFHHSEYLDDLIQAPKGKLSPEAFLKGIGSPECPVFKGMFEYACLAAGASLVSAEKILNGEARITFNTLGGLHHAMSDKASGFCYLNDAVLACLLLKDAGGKVLYLDIDAHHGDGVQEAFYQDPSVFTVSMHQNGKTLFPGTGFENEIGEGKGKGYSMNIPFPVDTYDEIYMKAFNEVVAPTISQYNPDVIVLALGMDSLAGDPLANLLLTNNVYADIVEKVMRYKKPILALGGGGYNVEATSRGWALVWSIFCGEDGGIEAALGLGGDMLGNRDWYGGFRDRQRAVALEEKIAIDKEVEATIKLVQKLNFPFLGL